MGSWAFEVVASGDEGETPRIVKLSAWRVPSGLDHRGGGWEGGSREAGRRPGRSPLRPDAARVLGSGRCWNDGRELLSPGGCFLKQTASVAPEPVIIAPYDPRWPKRFAREQERLCAVAGSSFVAVEHVGSTSVPACSAKPILDIMAGIRSLAEFPALIAPLASLGYEYVPGQERLIPERRFLRRPSEPRPRTHHLHVVEMASSFWRDHLLFRDWLRSHPEDVQRYERLKLELATRHRQDRAAYTEAKTGFIEGILARSCMTAR
jgi:GrpB-like predicted nucleotidyltransferase (UPF0157 family)